MSGLCDLHDYPADQWVAIATAVRDSVSMPANAGNASPCADSAEAGASRVELPA